MVHSLAEWDGGNFLGQGDSACLREAAVQNLTLVTYNRRTISLLLKAWTEEGRSHAGVIFVDEKNILPSNIDARVRSLTQLYKEAGRLDWKDRVIFLRRRP